MMEIMPAMTPRNISHCCHVHIGAE
jgi:hypothetical protein